MASLFGELRRRNVFKVAMAYAIVGWLLAQIADVAFPALLLPEWVLRAFIVFLALGFPIALLLAWAFELTPEGVKRSGEVPAAESTTHVTGRTLSYVVIGLLALAVVFLAVDDYLPDTGGEPPTIQPASDAPGAPPASVTGAAALSPAAAPRAEPPQRAALPNSIAVLPFANVSPDPNDAYFAIGLHDEILNQLAKLRALNVIARTSVLSYAEGGKSIPEIAAELNVETVMEGTVRYAGNRVRVTTQLIDPGTGAHLWSETYDRNFEDIFAIESDIAMNVANAMEAEFSVAEQTEIEARPTDSPEAYALYLRALAAWSSSDEVRGFAALDRATEIDPQFALAHALKAYWQGFGLPGPDTERHAIAREAAERALVLDPDLGMAHAALAMLHFANREDALAEQAFERTLELTPNEPDVLNLYNRFRRYRTEYDEGIELGRRAVALDPNNPSLLYQLAVTLRYAGNLEEALSVFRTARDLNPTVSQYHGQIAFTEIGLGNTEEALRLLQVAEQLLREVRPTDLVMSWRIGQLAFGYGALGRRDDVERLAGELDEYELGGPRRDAVWAMVSLALGDYDEALERLEAAVAYPSPDMLTLSEIQANAYRDPELDSPRFQEVLDRLNN